jgi:hypothetical protein
MMTASLSSVPDPRMLSSVPSSNATSRPHQIKFLVSEDSAPDGLTPQDSLLTYDDMRKRLMTLVHGHQGGEGFG